MAYALSYSLVLGSSKVGLNLRAQLIDTVGDAVGSPITSGFVERGKGCYLWYYDAFPDGFRGGIDFYDNDTDEFLTFASANPEEAENLDQKISSVASSIQTPPTVEEIAAEVDAVLGATHGDGEWEAAASLVLDLLQQITSGYPPNTVGWVLNNLRPGDVFISSPFNGLRNVAIPMIIGDDYYYEDSRAIPIRQGPESWPDLSDPATTLTLYCGEIEVSGIVDPADPTILWFDMGSTDTAIFTEAAHPFYVEAILPNDHRARLRKGTLVFTTT